MPLSSSLLLVGVNLTTNSLLFSANPGALVTNTIFPNEQTVAVWKVVLEGALIIGAVWVSVLPKQLHSIAEFSFEHFTVGHP